MKKFLLLTIFLLILMGCSNKSNYIEEAKLTKDQKEIFDLFNTEVNYKIYDFKVDENVKTYKMNIYKREEGEWKKYSGLKDSDFNENNGRVIVYYNNEEINYISKENDRNQKFSSPIEVNKEEWFSIGFNLSGRVDIEYNKEIPIGIFIFSDVNKGIQSTDMSEFFEPDRIDQQNYEAVYAITILFED